MFRSILLVLIYSMTSLSFATTHNPQEFLNSIRGQKDEGKQIVEQFCSTCHAAKPLIELGAPKINDAAAWRLRSQQGMDKLFAHVQEGMGAMPARGGCFECSDEQLRLAILELLPDKKVYN